MNRFFRKLPLMAKLLMIVVIPLVFAGYLTSQLYREKSSNLEQINGYLDQIHQAAIVTGLIDQLQLERRFSFEYALRNLHKEEMLAQRPRTDSFLKQLRTKDDTFKGFEQYSFIDRIDSVRSRVDRRQSSANAIMHFYSTAVFRLSSLVRAPSYSREFLANVTDELIVQKLLSELITYQSIISANIYNILYTRQFVAQTLAGSYPTYDVYKLVEKELMAKATPSLMQRYRQLKEGPMRPVQQYFQKAFSKFDVDSSYTVEAWKNVAVKSLGEMRSFQNQLLQTAEETITKYYSQEKEAKTKAIFFLLLVTVLLLLMTSYIVIIISQSLRALRRAALQLAQGKTGIRIPAQSNDAMGDLALAIREVDEKKRELAAAAQEIGKGHFDVAVHPRSKDDVLGNALVQMKENLLQYTTELKKTREEFVQLADFMPQIVWTARPDGYFDYYNKKWYEITGAKEGYGDQSWIPFFHPADVGYCLATWYQSVETGEPYEIEYRLKDVRSNDYRWFLGRALPIKNEKGEVLKWFGTATDIHDQKVQNERLEDLVAKRTLELNRSNEDLQQFAHVASHDLKEPLRKIRTFSSRLVEEYGSLIPDKGRTYIEKLQNSSERMSNMIDSILNYSIINATEQLEETVNLNMVFDGIRNDLELMMLQKEAKLEYHQLPKIKGVPTLLYQLFYNLVNNALKFSKSGTPSRICINARKVNRSEIDAAVDIEKADAYWQILVEDNGIGFNQEYADKMFHVFTRLNARAAYEGTGLGLALCKKIVHRHHGDIYARGEEGKGAQFFIILPIKN